jgi:hypothetical protein
MAFETRECGGALIRGQWLRLGDKVTEHGPNDASWLRRVWAVYRDGVFMGIKVHIERVDFTQRYRGQTYAPLDTIPA